MNPVAIFFRIFFGNTDKVPSLMLHFDILSPIEDLFEVFAGSLITTSSSYQAHAKPTGFSFWLMIEVVVLLENFDPIMWYEKTQLIAED